MSNAGKSHPNGGLNAPDWLRGPGAPPQIPDYQMLRVIGSGSYGEVWLARNSAGAWRAVKVVYRDRFENARPYEREFLGIQRYEPISRTNEGLVVVLAIGRNDAEGYFYYVMELADDAAPRRYEGAFPGLDFARLYIPRTLSLDLIRRGRLSLEECVTLGMKLNLALRHLHRHGLIHRDVKPANVIYVNGVPKLADIGLIAHMTGARSFVGTEGYVPPEGPNSPQADLFSLGRLLYEASMGKDRREFPAPFTGLGLHPEADGLLELNAVIQRACAPERKDRYRTAEEMNADLALLHSGKSVRLKHTVERRLKITTRVAVAALAVMVLGIFPYALAIMEARSARRASREARASETKAADARIREAQARATAEQRLYDSLVGEARATRMARRAGYRDEVFSLLKQANALEVPSKNPDELRREAGACLGDFVGLPPVTLDDFPTNLMIRRMVLGPEGRSAAFLLEGGLVVLRQLPCGTEIGRLQLKGDLPVRSLAFNSDGDELVFVRLPASGPSARQLENRLPHARVNVWKRDDVGDWSEVEDFPLPGALDCLHTRRGVFVTVFSQKPHRGRLVAVQGRAVEHEFEIPSDFIPEVAMSPDGQYLVTEMTESLEPAGSGVSEGTVPKDSVLDVWDLGTSRRVTRLTPQQGMLRSVGFSPEGEYLMSASRSSGGVVYVVNGFRRVTEFNADARESLEFAPGGHLMALPSTEGNRIRFWNWFSNDELAVLDEPRPATSAAFAPDGSYFITVSLHQARLYRLDQTPEKLNLPRHAGTLPSAAFSPDGFQIATVGLSPEVRVCAAVDGREIWSAGGRLSQSYGPAFGPDGRWFVTGELLGRHVTFWNAQTCECLAEVPGKVGGRLWSVQVSPDGRYLATASSVNRTNESGVELFSIQEQPLEGIKVRLIETAGTSAWSPVFAPDSRSLAYIDRDLKGIYFWEFESQSGPRCLATNLISGIGNDQGLCFTRDGRRLVMVNNERRIVTLEVATGEQVASFPTVDPRRTPDWTFSAGISLSPDGIKLAMVSASGRGVEVWELEKGRLLYALPEQGDTVGWLAWSPDSQRLAVTRANGEIAIWNLPEVERILARLGLCR